MKHRPLQPDEYYYLDALHNGHGPVSADFIRKLIHKVNVMVWRPGLPDWTPASALPEFARIHVAEADPKLREMLELCHHIIADGVVSDEEASALREWLQKHPHIATIWPGKVLAARLAEIFRDGKISEVERVDLRLLLSRLAVEPPAPAVVAAAQDDAIFDRPPPHIGFHGRRFCYAGRFVFGPKERCQQVTLRRGGQVDFEPAWDTHYLVVGAVEPDRDLIARAQALKQRGSVCKIVSEEHWTKFVRVAAPSW